MFLLRLVSVSLWLGMCSTILHQPALIVMHQDSMDHLLDVSRQNVGVITSVEHAVHDVLLAVFEPSESPHSPQDEGAIIIGFKTESSSVLGTSTIASADLQLSGPQVRYETNSLLPQRNIR